MPFKRLKYTYDYCMANPLGFSIILILVFAINFLNENAEYIKTDYELLLWVMAFLILIFLYGYGMVITKDVIKDGKKLPKILFKECLVYGIKSLIVITIYNSIQSFLLMIISESFYFAEFELENAVTNPFLIIDLFYHNDSIQTIEFIAISVIITYICVFFMEISLARLADGGKILKSFNIVSIFRCINIIGWRNYTIDYTKILLAIAILTYLQYGIDFLGDVSYITSIVFGLLIFIIEYIGIGKIYRTYKINKLSDSEKEVIEVN